MCRWVAFFVAGMIVLTACGNDGGTRGGLTRSQRLACVTSLSEVDAGELVVETVALDAGFLTVTQWSTASAGITTDSRTFGEAAAEISSGRITPEQVRVLIEFEESFEGNVGMLNAYLDTPDGTAACLTALDRGLLSTDP